MGTKSPCAENLAIIPSGNKIHVGGGGVMFRSLTSVLLRSFFAIVAGMLIGELLSVVTGLILVLILARFGLISFAYVVSGWALLLALIYGGIYTVLSGYVTAALAPNRPLGHAVTLGVIGVVLTAIAFHPAWSKSAGYEWYPIALIIITLPCCYLGGRLRGRR